MQGGLPPALVPKKYRSEIPNELTTHVMPFKITHK